MFSAEETIFSSDMTALWGMSSPLFSFQQENKWKFVRILEKFWTEEMDMHKMLYCTNLLCKLDKVPVFKALTVNTQKYILNFILLIALIRFKVLKKMYVIKVHYIYIIYIFICRPYSQTSIICPKYSLVAGQFENIT